MRPWLCLGGLWSWESEVDSIERYQQFIGAPEFGESVDNAWLPIPVSDMIDTNKGKMLRPTIELPRQSLHVYKRSWNTFHP